MIQRWKTITLRRRVAWGLLVVAMLVLVGHLIWHYSLWVSSVLLIASVVVSQAGENPGAKKPQQYDPNRR